MTCRSSWNSLRPRRHSRRRSLQIYSAPGRLSTTVLFQSAGVRVIIITRLPSNLRQTTRECVYLRRCCHFRSRDKDGGYTIRSDIFENLNDARKLHGSIFYRTGLIANRSRGNMCIGIFASFCSCDLDLKPMTFTYEVDPYPRKLYTRKMNFLR